MALQSNLIGNTDISEYGQSLTGAISNIGANGGSPGYRVVPLRHTYSLPPGPGNAQKYDFDLSPYNFTDKTKMYAVYGKYSYSWGGNYGCSHLDCIISSTTKLRTECYNGAASVNNQYHNVTWSILIFEFE